MRDVAYEALKAMTWERAKGELRALVAAQGSIPSDYETPPAEKTWVRMRDAVGAFIKHVEDEGLCD